MDHRIRTASLTFFGLIITLTAAGCQKNTSPTITGPGAVDSGTPDSGTPMALLSIPTGCNPLAANADCLLPYPSDVFLTTDASLPSGKRVAFTEQAKIKGVSGAIDFTTLHPADGWSHGSQIMALFPTGVDPSNLPGLNAPVADNSGPVLLFEADTEAPVLRFAELDPLATQDSRRALFIRPLVKLKNKTRYIVAVRNLVGKDGQPVPVPEGFRRIRDGQTAGDTILDPLAQRYQTELFPQLAAAGVDRSSLQLAWDFTTESEENVTQDMLRARSLALASMTATPPRVTITQVQTDVADASVAIRITGTLQVPLFMTNANPGAKLFRDSQGKVAQNGMAEVPFTLQVPPSVANGTQPARFLQFGHGFFGSQAEADSPSPTGFVRPFIRATEMVVMTVDWWGMSNADQPVVAKSILHSPSNTMLFTDRVHQAMVNQMAVTFAAKTTLAQLPALKRGNGDLMYDPNQIFFYGISQGHILGGTYMSLTPHIDRAVLSVGGANFSFMLYRALPFQQILGLVERQVPDELDRQKFGAQMQNSFDRIDPLTYGPHFLTNTYPQNPASRSVLFQYGLGDAEVPNAATELHARVLGIPQLLPARKEIPYLPTTALPASGSGVEQPDFGIAAPLPGTVPDLSWPTNAVHEGVRRDPEGRDQVNQFLHPDGQIVDTCSGAPCLGTP